MGKIERAGSTLSWTTYGVRCAWRIARSRGVGELEARRYSRPVAPRITQVDMEAATPQHAAPVFQLIRRYYFGRVAGFPEEIPHDLVFALGTAGERRTEFEDRDVGLL